MSYGEGTLDQQAISYAKQRLRDGVGDATIMVELQQKFAPITEGAVAAMYLMAAKRDAPRPRSFRMTAQVVDGRIRYRAYEADATAEPHQREVEVQVFRREMGAYYGAVEIERIVETLAAKDFPEVILDSHADAPKVRYFELIA